MTPREHAFFFALFAKQTQQIKILLDILKSREILTGDDARAFEFSQTANVASNVALFRQSKAAYLQLAKSLGIETGLENLEPPPQETFRPQNP